MARSQDRRPRLSAEAARRTVGASFDTNILADYLNGATQARSEFARYDRCAISVITRMKVLVGADGETDAPARAFLRTFDMIDLDAQVADRAVALRKRYRIKLPDAIVWASAQAHDLLFVTRNTKDFTNDDPCRAAFDKPEVWIQQVGGPGLSTVQAVRTSST